MATMPTCKGSYASHLLRLRTWSETKATEYAAAVSNPSGVASVGDNALISGLLRCLAPKRFSLKLYSRRLEYSITPPSRAMRAARPSACSECFRE